MIKGVEDMRWLTLNTKWIRINSKVGVPMAPVFSVRESLASLHGRNQIHLVPISIGWCVGIRKGSKWRARPHPMNRNTTSSATMVTNQEICWGKSDGGARNGEAGISEET